MALWDNGHMGCLFISPLPPRGDLGPKSLAPMFVIASWLRFLSVFLPSIFRLNSRPSSGTGFLLILTPKWLKFWPSIDQKLVSKPCVFRPSFSHRFFVDFWSILALLLGGKNGLNFSKSHFGPPKTAKRPIWERPKIDLFSLSPPGTPPGRIFDRFGTVPGPIFDRFWGSWDLFLIPFGSLFGVVFCFVNIVHLLPTDAFPRPGAGILP